MTLSRDSLNSNGKWFFLVALLLVNLIQAAYTQLTGDEALYWMHSRNMDWGFRDHPPAIASMIGIGYSFFKSELGVRLLVVLANTITIGLIYRLTKPRALWHFVLLVLSLPALNIYGFIATPDVPLLLSTALYLNVWEKFLENQNTRNTWLLAACMAALVWSKYHGILVIMLLILPQRKLWFSRHFWMAACGGILLYSPHIIWQIVNDLPSIKFHINDRNSDAWELKHILGYIGGQLMVFNPVVLFWLIYVMIKNKAATDFERSLRWFITGLMVMFFINSFRGRVEPHWTAPLAIAVIFILVKEIERKGLKPSVKYALVSISLLLLLVRSALIFDFIPQLYRDFHRDEAKMNAIHEVAGDLPVCFMNSYQNPALYTFYTGNTAHSINNTEGGKNQYDYWNYAVWFNKKPFLFVASYDAPEFEKVKSDKFEFNMRKYVDLPLLHDLQIRTDEWLHRFHPGDTAKIAAVIVNNNSYEIDFADSLHNIQWMAMYNHKKPNEANERLEIIGMPQNLMPGESKRIELRFLIPNRLGRNYLLFAAKIDELPPTYQSNKIRMMID